ncbi:RNA polymerase sigma factor [Marinimicrobium agarilyticum]|uniref:RNA polymerase sigma factor n=1 Tax=Marinimicrobium agarilyticum TaxID=306546 RepID=UPI00040C3DD7|nr:sigma-70 family RNA polymerase sigma factor [Marinimicrobium agarilyticum]
MNLANITDRREADNVMRWVDQARRGDVRAFERVVRHYQDRLRSYLAQRTDYSRDVDDLAQETFVVAWRKLHTLEEPSAFSGWLFTIAKNLLCNHQRKQARVEPTEPEHLAQMLDREPEDGSDEGVEATLSLLRQCLLKLSHEAQRTIRLYYREGYSLRELRDALGVRHSTLTMRLNRYRQNLRECINRGF